MSIKEVTIEGLSRQVDALEARLASLESNSPKGLLSVKEATALLGIKPDTSRRWVQSKKITFERIGRHLKFKLRTIGYFRRQRREYSSEQLLRSRNSG